MRLAVALLFAALVAGCGKSQSLGQVALDLAATKTAPTGTAPHPHWSRHGCAVHSQSSIDYVREPDGHPTPAAAALAWGTGTAGLRAVTVPRRPHSARGVWLVEDGGVIRRKVSVTRGSTGWFVDGVEECGHR